MAKVVYCSECGMKLPIARKALPQFGRIIDVIEPHECLEEPADIDLEPVDFTPVTGGKVNERPFLRKLDELEKEHPRGGIIGTDTLRDRRKSEDVKSSAPTSLVDSIKSMSNTTPDKDIEDEPAE